MSGQISQRELRNDSGHIMRAIDEGNVRGDRNGRSVTECATGAHWTDALAALADGQPPATYQSAEPLPPDMAHPGSRG